MITSQAIDVYPATPLAWLPKRKQFYDLIKKHGGKIVSEQLLNRLTPNENKKFIQIIFNVNITGCDQIYNIKQLLKKIFYLIDNGYNKCTAIKYSILEDFQNK